MRHAAFSVLLFLASLLAACGDSGGAADPGAGGSGGRGAGGSDESKAADLPCSEEGLLEAVSQGGGPHSFACDDASDVLTLSGTVVIDQDVALDGRGMATIRGAGDHVVFHVLEGVTADLIGFVVTGGRSAENAGGIDNEGILTLQGTTVTGNVGVNAGGIFNDRRASLTLEDSAVVENVGKHAGGIESWGGLFVAKSRVVRNVGDVGGIANHGDANLTDIVITANEGSAVGGLSNDEGGTAVVLRSVIEDNAAESVGGARNVEGSLTLRGTSVVRNQSDDIGGIWNDAHGALLLLDSSLAGNSGESVGAIKNESLGVARLFRSMVLGNEGEVSGIDNRGPGNVVLDTSLIADTCSGVIISAGNNVMEKGIACGYDPALGDGNKLFTNWLF